MTQARGPSMPTARLPFAAAHKPARRLHRHWPLPGARLGRPHQLPREVGTRAGLRAPNARTHARGVQVLGGGVAQGGHSGALREGQPGAWHPYDGRHVGRRQADAQILHHVRQRAGRSARPPPGHCRAPTQSHEDHASALRRLPWQGCQGACASAGRDRGIPSTRAAPCRARTRASWRKRCGPFSTTTRLCTTRTRATPPTCVARRRGVSNPFNSPGPHLTLAVVSRLPRSRGSARARLHWLLLHRRCLR